MFGQYKRITNEFTGVLTGKGLEYGGIAGSGHIGYVRCAIIAGFVKVADAMMAYGVV